MQNKGLIKLFVVLFALVSIYQLSFTFVTGRVEAKAQQYANEKISQDQADYVAKREQAQAHYLDSVGGQTAYNIGIAKYTYNEAKEKELNQGLDLKGGINVILQISVKDILKGLANNSKDPIFNKSLLEADENIRKTDETYLDLFFEAYERNGGKLSSPDVFANKNLSDEINFQMPDSEVLPIIRRKVDESIVSAFEVLRKRIDKFGVSQPNIQRLGTSGRILVELPGAKDIDRVKSLLQSTAQLEFWETYKNTEVYPYLQSLNKYLASLQEQSQSETQQDEKQVDSAIDSLVADVAKDSIQKQNQVNPLFDLVKAPSYENSPVIFVFSIKDTATINGYLNSPEAKRLREFPNNLQNIHFAWGKPEKGSDLVSLYAIKGNREHKAPLTGGVITDARQTYDVRNSPAVSMQMDAKGSKIWENLTGKAYAEQGNIAIVLDDVVYSAPGVTSGAISGGRSEITGHFSLQEAVDLANVLRAGKLPAGATIIQSEIVGPSLGQEAIDSGFNSFVIAIIVIFFWMFFYYGRAGIYADVALVLNILLIFGILAGLGAVLTLPGIAGIVLTIGMSIDANVLIFERVKEELERGKNIAKSVSDGFSNALSSILDANITTGLTGVVLLIFGSGPIQGFATTLLIGIATSLFTAIFVTRLFVDKAVEDKRNLTFSTNLTKNLLKGVKMNFLGNGKVNIAYYISGAIILISVLSIQFKGLNQGIDFVGGRSYQIRFEHPVNATQIAKDLSDIFGSAEVKTFGGENQIKVTTKYKVDEESTEVDDEIQEKLYEGLKSFLPQGYTYDQFIQGGDENLKVGILQSMKVGPTIAEDIKTSAFWAIVGSLIIVFMYILLRFRKWQFSLGAVVALVHDVLIVLGVFSLTYNIMPFDMEIDQSFIAAILTVIGYSLNDTVIIFDRIRETVSEKGWSSSSINLALNSTLTRTLNTSATTLVVLIAIFIFGGESLRGFMFAMIIGILVGTYSSIFIATPVMFNTLKRKSVKEQEDNLTDK